MTLYPIEPVVMPGDLYGQTNGRLPSGLLSPIDGGGKLHHLAARSWRALCDAAWREVGLPLTFTYGGDYRSYSAQETLFRSRYDPSGTGGGCKTWNGVRWCKKSANLATAAVPGTSNHGWGLAVDCAWDRDLTDGIGPDDATAITSHPGWSWLLANAHRFGFSWELQSEPWHLRYVAGDMVPVETLLFESPPPPTTDEVDMIALDYTNPKTGQWTALTFTGTHLAHTDGFADQVIREAKVHRETINDAQLDGFIRSATTTTAPPPEFSSARKAAWNKSRG